MKTIDKKLIQFVRFSRGISSAAAADALRKMKADELEVVKEKAANFERPKRKPRGLAEKKPAKDKVAK